MLARKTIFSIHKSSCSIQIHSIRRPGRPIHTNTLLILYCAVRSCSVFRSDLHYYLYQMTNWLNRIEQNIIAVVRSRGEKKETTNGSQLLLPIDQSKRKQVWNFSDTLDDASHRSLFVCHVQSQVCKWDFFCFFPIHLYITYLICWQNRTRVLVEPTSHHIFQSLSVLNNFLSVVSGMKIF